MTGERDEDLLAAWRDGDTDAGERLYDRHFVTLSRFFRNKVAAGVDDLLQATFVRLVESKDRFRGEGSFRSFLFGVAYNVLRQHYRRTRRDAERLDFSVTSVFDLGDGPSAALAKRQEERLLLEALRRVPLEHQVLLELYFWEPLTAPDIAAALDVPVGTVRTRLRRAKELLRQQLQGLTDDPEILHSTISGLEDWAKAVRDAAVLAS